MKFTAIAVLGLVLGVLGCGGEPLPASGAPPCPVATVTGSICPGVRTVYSCVLCADGDGVQGAGLPILPPGHPVSSCEVADDGGGSAGICVASCDDCPPNL